jgi:hypothetical protein
MWLKVYDVAYTRKYIYHSMQSTLCNPSKLKWFKFKTAKQPYANISHSHLTKLILTAYDITGKR